MATITEVQSSASVLIPAGYLEDARRAVLAEIHNDSSALKDDDAIDRESSASILRRDMRLLDQILGATEDTTVESEQDGTSTPVVEMLEEIIKVLSKRLQRTSDYGPLPMGDVLDIAERLRWAAEEAIRVEPGINQRLSVDEIRDDR
jgi:hypothetical protein